MNTAPALPWWSNWVGRSVGAYRLVAFLGEGGMGAVFLADSVATTQVAVKILHQDLLLNSEAIRRFLNEARTMKDLDHPNIVRILDCATEQQPDGHLAVYLVMEYVAGEPLSKLIHREAQIPAARAVRMALQIAEALAACHRKGIVHRDLKPENTLIQGEQVKVVDFGIAKVVGEDRPGMRTRTGVVLGTPGYMSPEQCRGQRDIDHRADIYSLGVLLYEMLAGARPYSGRDHGELLLAQLTQPLRLPSRVNPSVSAYLDGVVRKALELEPRDRFQSMDELSASLRQGLRQLDAVPKPAGRTGPGPFVVAPGVVGRLEQAFSEGRRWQRESFDESVAHHPVVRPAAQALVWGMYDEDHRLGRTFRLDENGAPLDAYDSLLPIPRGVHFGLPHPLELDEETRERWLRALASARLTQPFAQLERAVHRPTEEQAAGWALAIVERSRIYGQTLLELERFGWRLGTAQPDGLCRTIERPLGDGTLLASLAFQPGLSAHLPALSQVQELGRVVLRRVGEGRRPTYADLKPIAFSELVEGLLRVSCGSGATRGTPP